MKENRKTTSIARRINISFWFKRFFAFFWLDVLILALWVGVFAKICIDKLPEGADLEYGKNGFYFTMNEETEHIELHMVAQIPEESSLETETAGEKQVVRSEKFVFDTYDYIEYSEIPLIVILSFQGVNLFFFLFSTRGIRRKLRPLNDLAVQAEQLSNIPLDETHLEHLEAAIMNISPDASEARIKTGDKDLESIEIALNSLFIRMKESQKQQARFVSDASHELRTPISVIQGYVNMLDRWGKEDEKVLEEAIEALKQESDHMKELIEQLLFLARGDSGRNTLKQSEFDLREVVQEVWEESMMIDENHVYIFKQAKFEEDFDEEILDGQASTCDLPNAAKQEFLMVGDVSMIKQSLRIFVQNAAKYSNKGDAIQFTVKRNGNRISYAIQDEGVGMQEADVSHIFERFYRSDAARNGETGGSGLGLSIAKWIVDAHDGTIDVLSRPDFGTRFTVDFPIKALPKVEE